MSVTAQTLTCALTLTQIRDALSARPPQTDGRIAGWRSSEDASSNLNAQNGVPPTAAPQILPAEGFAPERLAARYYFWEQRKLNDGVSQGWFLDAVDVLISVHDNRYLVLWSSHNANLIDPAKGDAARSLTSLMITEDEVRPELSDDSPLRIIHDDIYLWLTSKADRREPLSGGVVVNTVQSLTTGENTSGRRVTTRRSGHLAGAVDLSRISFLTAVATESTLGPAVVTLGAPNDDGTFDQLTARIWRESQFKILTTPSHIRAGVYDNTQKRLHLVHAFAYRYIPLIISERLSDDDWTDARRGRLVIEKQIELARAFRDLAQANPLWPAYAAENGDEVFSTPAATEAPG